MKAKAILKVITRTVKHPKNAEKAGSDKNQVKEHVPKE